MYIYACSHSYIIIDKWKKWNSLSRVKMLKTETAGNITRLKTQTKYSSNIVNAEDGLLSPSY